MTDHALPFGHVCLHSRVEFATRILTPEGEAVCEINDKRTYLLLGHFVLACGVRQLLLDERRAHVSRTERVDRHVSGADLLAHAFRDQRAKYGLLRHRKEGMCCNKSNESLDVLKRVNRNVSSANL